MALTVGGIIIVGTVIESGWTGSMQPCSRSIDADNSTFQYGDDSIRWLPPQIHCRFRPAGIQGSATENRWAVAGIALAGAVGVATLVVVSSASGIYRRQMRQHRTRKARANATQVS